MGDVESFLVSKVALSFLAAEVSSAVLMGKLVVKSTFSTASSSAGGMPMAGRSSAVPLPVPLASSVVTCTGRTTAMI